MSAIRYTEEFKRDAVAQVRQSVTVRMSHRVSLTENVENGNQRCVIT